MKAKDSLRTMNPRVEVGYKLMTYVLAFDYFYFKLKSNKVIQSFFKQTYRNLLYQGGFFGTLLE